MDVRRRFELLAHAAALDRDARRVGLARAREVGAAVGVTRVRLPGGGSMGMMRVMQTNACSLACGYCPTFCGGEVKRATLTPDETASAFAEAHRKGIADGLFLTSGVPGRPERATDRMLATIELLRRREGFRGYVHVKLLPGAERAQVERAVALATRVSVNLEAPADGYVRRLAPDKDLSGDLMPKLELAGRLSREAARERVGQRGCATTTTQFVVGAAGERDREILGIVGRLERERLLHHAHFSAFQPVAGTPMEGEPPAPATRELRLYQAEHLLREYGFGFDELVFEPDGNLALDHDPKTAWALAHPEHFPLALESAPLELLLRVPGIGPATARAVVRERRRVVFSWAGALRHLGIDTVRAGWFVTLRGRRLASTRPATQLRLFPHGDHLTHAASRTAVPPCAFR
jgi:predicted DNA-binding helix-hairpin-helix protein